ncbi:hypothetical protein Mal35_29520 [Gimesia maris]|uniref:Uncharacterized protein n=1 Tax=Gimesia maris TaxID=122 RepID=A0A3D3R786_9PLAN|nr:hypothetical protein [Gimesia maris]MAC54974.1 hypothetical protein [Gimesia sp.]QDT79488.1 hypothetical protein Mal35_29520 [Gimesia maris]HCO24685.1 hypothetical protein [Gimesia maris]|tara:strand:+ start:1049 stop:1567 length:519 start_codon:yes stop_codon:yes gene_type:complete
MQKWLLLILVCFPTCGTAAAEDLYLLRLDAIGYDKSSEEPPQEKVMQSIEVVARLNELFHSKVKSGPETQMLSGKMYSKDGELKVRLHYHRLVDVGNVVPVSIDKDGTVITEPVLGRNEIETTVGMKINKATLVGGFETDSESTQGSITTISKSKTHYQLFLSRYEPPAEKR